MSTSTVVQSTRPGVRQIGNRRPLSPSNPERQARSTPIRRVQAANTQTIDPKEYRHLLLARKTELASSLQSRPGVLAELAHVAEEDQAPVIHSEFIAVRINQISYEQLGLMDAALARLDSGEYGICVECDRPIAAKRLAAVPWASHCVACQERLDPLERTHT